MHQVRADLERLRHIVDSSWAQDGHCLLVCMQDLWSAASQRASEAVQHRTAMIKALGFQPREMFRWNDQKGRTKAEVLDLIDSALQGA